MNTASATSRLDVNLTLELERFSLQVSIRPAGQVTGVFGPSGSGKTSLLEVLAGLRRSARGIVKLGDTVFQDSASGIFLPPEQRGIGYVPQAGLLFPHRTVQQNLRFGARKTRSGTAPGIGGRPAFPDVVDLLELGPLLARNTGALSGGERQRVALGRALCSSPDLLLLDEPLAALDHGLRHRILPFLRRIREEFKLPMVLVSHDPVEVQALCDDLVALRDGKVIARGAPNDVLLDPEVFFSAEERSFQNIVPCSTVSSDNVQTVVALGNAQSDVTMAMPNRSGPRQGAQFVGIPARDILVATAKPVGISARNILAATLGEMHHMGGFVLIKAQLGHGIPPLAVEVTRPACEELDLTTGREVYLIIKSMSCTLYGERPSAESRQPVQA